MITAKIISDSINPFGDRITSFILEYPLFIHSEFLTHRMFSRNAASARAIPIQVMIDKVEKNPATPIIWPKNNKGMKSVDLISNPEEARSLWLESARQAVYYARKMKDLGLHKHVVNRILSPYLYINVLVTATDYDNFFCLRFNPEASPEMIRLSHAMILEYRNSQPNYLELGDWHIPFADNSLDLETKLKVSVARCARLSYNNHYGVISIEDDIKLYNNLISNRHMSPFEHQAVSSESDRFFNLKGWKSYRYLLNLENVYFDYYESLKKFEKLEYLCAK
ncbi:MAG: hypothetical protein SNJ64_01875 [Endomicrobiia bacterium]